MTPDAATLALAQRFHEAYQQAWPSAAVRRAWSELTPTEHACWLAVAREAERYANERLNELLDSLPTGDD